MPFLKFNRISQNREYYLICQVEYEAHQWKGNAFIVVMILWITLRQEKEYIAIIAASVSFITVTMKNIEKNVKNIQKNGMR